MRKAAMAVGLWVAFLMVALGASLFSPRDASANAIQVRPYEVRSYQHDFGVSAQVAERHLVTQDRGAGVVEELKGSLGKHYAGVWFDNESGEFVVPMLPSSSRATLDSEFTRDHLAGEFRTVAARFSWAELKAAHERVDRALLPLIEAGLLQTSVDPQINSVVISEDPGASADHEAQVETVAGAESVSVEVRKESVQSTQIGPLSCNAAGIHICSNPLRGGVGIGPEGEGLQCTAAFKGLGNVYGNRFMLTAGHCADGRVNWHSMDAAGYPVRIGEMEEWVWPGGDWAKINANGSAWDKPSWPSEVAWWGTNQEYPIDSESWSYLGEYACHSGYTTGSSCGTVTGLDFTVKMVISGAIEYHLAELYPVCAEGGDSGGPVFTGGGHTALGILSAGNIEISCGNTVFYVEIPEAADAMGLTVGPRLGTVPLAETLGASEFQPLQVNLQGQVSPHGILTNYHFEYGTTTAYGQSTSLLGAGSGPSWQAVSQNIGGLKGQTTYHYRLVAQNSAGTSFGGDKQFATPVVPPAITPEAPTAVGVHSATLNASINPQGAATSYRFEYGTTTSYGQSVPVPNAAIGSGTTPVKVSRALSGLGPERGYHYRVVATSAEGTTTSPDQTFSTLANAPSFVSSFGGKGTGNGQFTSPAGVVMSPGGIVVGGNGNLYATDSGGNRVEKFGPAGEYLSQFGTGGSGNGQFNAPLGIALDPAGHLFVADANNRRIEEVSANGAFIAQFGPGEGSEPLYAPWDVVADKAGHIFAADPIRAAVYEYSVEGLGPEGNHLLAVIPYTLAEREGRAPIGLGYEPGGGNVWGVDASKSHVEQYMLNCGGCAEHPALFTRFGTEGSGPGQLKQPYDVAVRPSGSLLVLDHGNNRVEQFSQAGELLANFGAAGSGPGQLNQPFSIAYGKGSIYVADAGNNRIERWTQVGQPEAITQAATAIGSSGATLNALIAPVGASTTYHFEYGTTTAYGTKAPAPDEAVGSGFEAVAKAKAISGLTPETTYHYRVVATSPEGTAYGEDMTFKTTK
jgi:hypothetical protein